MKIQLTKVIPFIILLSAFCHSARAQLTFDPASPPTSATPPTEEYNEYTGTNSHQKGPKAFIIILVDTDDKPWTTNVRTQTDYQTPIDRLSQRYYDSSGHQTWVGDKRKDGLTIPRLHVTPVVRLPNAASYYTDSTFSDLFSHAIAAVRALGGDYATGGRLDPAKFDRVMCDSGSFKGISSTGLAYVGGKYSWPGGAFEHELGHNWGCNHANFWQRPAGSTLPRDIDGDSTEYGDGSDVMGGGGTLFTALFKAASLGFLESSRGEVQSITASGTYRLYSHTQGFVRNDTTKLRALQLQLTGGGSPAYLGYRFETSGTTDGGDSRNSRDRNAIQFHWNVGGANFIDTTPDSRLDDDKIDGSIKIGRTYSEPATSQDIDNYYGGLHITPIARGVTTAGNTPAGDHYYIDVVINRGSDVPAGNAAPTASFSANTVTATAGSAVSLSVTASDSNGDALAYDWDFGNGGYNITNSATQSPTYASAGLYLVKCTVSDMKGGTTTAFQWVNVGSQPTQDATSTTTISGLHYRTYSGTWSSMPNFEQLQPAASGTCAGFDLSIKPSNDNFAILYTGFIEVPATDTYQFEILSDDGAKLIIDGQTVINNDGAKNSALSKSGNITLAAGKHSVRLEYFHKDGTETLSVKWWRIGQSQEAIPSANLIQGDWAGNAAPTVSITSPASTDSFIVNSDISLTASATDDGTVTKVVFFANGSFLAEDTTAPYSTVWQKVSVGTQTITAIAYDATGRWTKSAPLAFSVVSPAPTRGFGLNFGADTVESKLSFNEAAGAVYAYKNWNNITGTKATTAVALNDHDGSTSTATLTYESDGTRSGIFSTNADTSTANGKLLRGGLGRDYDIGPPEPFATITDIPYAAYDVYVYFDGLETWDDDATTQRYLLTPTEGTAPGARFGRNSLTKNDGKGDYPTYDSWNGFREATATAVDDPADKLAGNYVVFRNQTASGFKLEATRNNGHTTGTVGRHRRYFNAIQVMQVTPSAPALVVRQTGGSTAVSEAGTRDTVTVALAFAPTADVTVTVAPGAQLTADKTSFTFTPSNWSQAQTLSLGAVNDATLEGAHTGTLTLTAAGGNYDGLAARTLTASITDDDQPTLSVGVRTATATEGTTPVAGVLRISRSGTATLSGAVTANFTITGTADKAADFTLSGGSVSFDTATGNGTLTLPAGVAFVDLTLTPTNDSTREDQETAILTLTTSSAYAVGSPASATLSIGDDERVDYFCQFFGTTYGTNDLDEKYGRDEYPADLNGISLTFVPDGSPSFYKASLRRNVTSYPTPTTGHTGLKSVALTAGDLNSGWWELDLPAKFYGTDFTKIFVSTEGGITFNSGLSTSYSSYGQEFNENHFVRQRISLFWYYLGLGSSAGGDANNANIFYSRITTPGQERTVITYDQVPYAYGASGTYGKLRGQIELWDNGTITLTWLEALTKMQGMVGFSRFANNTDYWMPSGFVESNLSAYPEASANTAPAFATVAPLSATTGSAYSYALTCSDVNGDTLTITAPTKPSWLTLTDNGNGTATFSGTPSASGSYAVTLRVSDGTATTDQSFTVTVAPSGGNTAPTITSTPGASPLVTVGGTYTYSVTASDADGHTLTLSATDLPSWLTFTDNGNGNATLTGTAPDVLISSHPVTLLVSDGLTGTTQAFTITLNRAPAISVTAPTGNVAELPSRNNALTLAATVTDDALPASPGAVTTTWSMVSGPGTVTFADASAASTSATFSTAGTYQLRLTATDGTATTTSDVYAYVETDADATLTTGLQGYWKFNEASGTTTADSSGNAKDLTLTGAVTFGTGVEGNAYLGSASDNQYGANTTLGHPSAMTFSAWVNSSVSPGDGGNFRYLLAFRTTNGVYVSLALPNASSTLQFRSSHNTQGVWNITGYKVPANEWFHVTVTYDQSSTANNPVVYINGQSVAVTRATAPSGSVNATDTTRIGGSGGNLNQAWKGSIDEARLYNRVVTADEAALLTRTASVNQAPSVTAGLRDPIPNGSNTATLVGTATDDGLPNGSTLTTTWSKVSGPGTVTFADASALNTTATFDSSGTYVVRLTGTDGAAQTYAELSLLVALETPVATTISVAPASITVLPSASTTFAATINDQYGRAMTGQTIAWSVSGGGSIDSSGVFTASTSEGGPHTVTATSGSLSATAQVTVFNNSPTISDIADRVVTQNISTGAVAFTIGDSETAAASLSVTASSSNQALVPNTNLTLGGSDTARTITATPANNQSGNATLTVTVSDGNKSASDTFLLTVQAGVVTSITVTPATASVQPNGTRQFTATVNDQNGSAMNPQPTVTWSATGAGTVNSSGLFTAGASNGSSTVTATASGVNGTATVTVTNTAPTVNITSPGTTAVSLPDRTDSLVLTATATDPEVTPTVTWSQVSGPGTTTFANSTALSTSATFSADGTYVLRVTASDGILTATKDLTVGVNTTVSALTGTNIGTGGSDGSHTTSGSSFSLVGAGGDIWGSADRCYFLSAPMSGDFTVTTRVASITAVSGTLNGWAKAGLMLRASTAANSRGAMIALTPSNGTALQGRTTDGGSWDNSNTGSRTAPYWIRLVRTGNVLQGFASPDGTTWTQQGSDKTISLTDPVQVGFVAAANTSSNGQPTAVFDNVSGLPTSNAAPQVNPGTAPAAIVGTAATLAGTSSDDGNPTPATLTTTWSKVSGPGTVTFGNASTAATTATFSAAGSYVLRLTATDGTATVFQDLTVTARTPFDNWATQAGLSGSNAAATADPDGDGIVNLLEYALGGDPTVNNASILPTVGTTTASSSTYLTLTFTPQRSDVTYTVEANSDLGDTWTALTMPTLTVGQSVTVTDSTALTTGTKRFLRLKVSQ